MSHGPEVPYIPEDERFYDGDNEDDLGNGAPEERAHFDIEAPVADAAEQSQAVGTDEDDEYR